MISPEEKTATADRLTDALAAAAAIMPPDGAHALSRPDRHRRTQVRAAADGVWYS